MKVSKFILHITKIIIAITLFCYIFLSYVNKTLNINQWDHDYIVGFILIIIVSTVLEVIFLITDILNGKAA
jgi:hypothetical protein